MIASIAAAVAFHSASTVAWADVVSYMIKARVGGRLLEGKPLSWSKERVYLLSRDGQLIDFRPQEAKDFHKSSPRFYSYSTSEIRNQLYTEFGRPFDVTGTGHYLVVHPRGQRDRWADRFERLYRSFYHYFRVRGIKMHEPQYPLIAIVFHNRDDYRRYADKTGSSLGPNTLGHYDDWTNRICLFDVTGGRPSRDWSRNAETIIHEATHQTAFNTGVHTRFVGVPRWLCEGLATHFESRGVWDANSSRTAKERVNPDQLRAFKTYLEQRREEGALEQLLASDRVFRSDVLGAYGEAWALTYYLSETQPHRYGKYLTVTASRSQFQKYSAQQRLKDFRTIFGDNLKTVEIQFLRFMRTVR
ncbi:MAG: DUF1570 domain-containing protein [Pirellulales bacterium]